MLLLFHRRKQPFGNGDSGDNDEDVGGPGSNDGDNGSTGGGGGDDWWSAGDEEGGYFRDAFSTLWLWQALCMCSVLQVSLAVHTRNVAASSLRQ